MAKQIGALGEGKRTDLMGLLLMISPPGYGKTTLMEYVADRLGLIFMKVNGPTLGHDVLSLDPEQAPNATARQELEKLNLALSYPYSDAEISEIISVIKHLIKLRDVVLKVNQQYIASAAQSDKYRTEPAFRLQGSYRNMNKLSEKISSVMNEEELERLLDDHYLGEAQLLTTGAEENLLKLAELRGTLTEQEAARWQQIKRDFMRNKALGGDNADVGDRVVAQLADLVESVQALSGQ